jgi:CheY-like chemotaxis protein
MSGTKVLIIEDNPGDVVIVEALLQELKVDLNISIAKDGHEALNILVNGRNGLPDLIILDLNLPKVHGFDVLKFIKADETLRAISVVVMTGSLRTEDEAISRELGASDYCLKPATILEMERTKMCLRGHLDGIVGRKRSGGVGPVPTLS